VNVVASIQYRALAGKASDAFYKLSNTRSQIQAYVFDGTSYQNNEKNYHIRRRHHFACFLLCAVSVVQFCFPFTHNTVDVCYWY
jgi:hypothetical protein